MYGVLVFNIGVVSYYIFFLVVGNLKYENVFMSSPIVPYSTMG